MKNTLYTVLIFTLILPGACGTGPIRSSYRPILPELPEHWEEILGPAHWRLEWLDGKGHWQVRDLDRDTKPPELSIIQELSNPVLAWPYWPSRDLHPGIMRPAGAIFPWDVSGGEVSLSWQGGVEAVFWKELAAAERPNQASQARVPWNLDWPRFRELISGANIPQNVREDLWLPDWKSIAQRTVQSGFDRRRIVSRTYTEHNIPGLWGLWISSSPFAAPIEADPEGLLILKAPIQPDTWVSSWAVLRASGTGWVLMERDNH